MNGPLCSSFMNHERTSMPTLKPHDVAVALQLAIAPGMPYRVLAESLTLSLGETHNAVKRLLLARLLRANDRAINTGALLEFLGAGVPYAFPTSPGPETRGIPTAHSAPPLSKEVSGADAVVWPSSDGRVRGASVEPLYPGATNTPTTNPKLYELLVLVDAIRIGRARERQRAKALLAKRLGMPGEA